MPHRWHRFTGLAAHGRGAPPGAAARTAGAAARVGARSAAPRRPACRQWRPRSSRRAPRCRAPPELLVTGLPSDRGDCAALIEELRAACSRALRGRAGRRRQRVTLSLHRAAGAPRASAATTSTRNAMPAVTQELDAPTPVWPADIDKRSSVPGRGIDVQRSWRQRAVQAAHGASMRRSARADRPRAARFGPAAGTSLSRAPPAAFRHPRRA